MSLETDLLMDRRRLKRRLVFWRCLAVGLGALAVLAALDSLGIGWSGAHVARLNVSGMIAEDRRLNEALASLAKDSDVKALIVTINSPGGSVVGGESLHRALSDVATKKPVVAVMGTLAASAGYMVALPAHRIFAREGTVTGSIGVLLQTGEISGLLDKVGVTAETITSGPLKNQPSLTTPLSPTGRNVLHGLVMDMYDQFVERVAAGRNMPPEKVRELADGRAYSGRQALSVGLIDAIGGEAEARAWLANTKAVPVSLPTEDVTTGSIASRAVSTSLTQILVSAWKALVSQSVSLDGGMAVWHRPTD